jgi:hypothetical protein
MFRISLAGLVCFLVVGLMACTAVSETPVTVTPAITIPSTTETQSEPTPTNVGSDSVSPATDTPLPETPTKEADNMISLTDAENIVKADLAAKLAVPASLIETKEEPRPGYQIILVYDEQLYDYHVDQDGRFVTCNQPDKPIDPIRR